MFENAFNSIDRLLRNDEGLASELDYVEQTSWILFLKYLDDLESERQDGAELEGLDYTPILDAPFRWGTWAAPKKNGEFDHNAAKTGDDLIDFVNHELFPYLQRFRETATGPDTMEYKIGEIFSEIVNKFRSGYSCATCWRSWTACPSTARRPSTSCRTSTRAASSAWATLGATAASTTRPARSSAP